MVDENNRIEDVPQATTISLYSAIQRKNVIFNRNLLQMSITESSKLSAAEQFFVDAPRESTKSAQSKHTTLGFVRSVALGSRTNHKSKRTTKYHVGRWNL